MKLFEAINEGEKMDTLASNTNISDKSKDEDSLEMLNDDADEMLGLDKAIEAHLEEVESKEKEKEVSTPVEADPSTDELNEEEICNLLADSPTASKESPIHEPMDVIEQDDSQKSADSQSLVEEKDTKQLETCNGKDLDDSSQECETATEKTGSPGPTESETSAAEPIHADPTEDDPTEDEPTEAEPTEDDPTEAEPTEADPTEADPTEADPTEADPTETGDVKDKESSKETSENEPIADQDQPNAESNADQSKTSPIEPESENGSVKDKLSLDSESESQSNGVDNVPEQKLSDSKPVVQNEISLVPVIDDSDDDDEDEKPEEDKNQQQAESESKPADKLPEKPENDEDKKDTLEMDTKVDYQQGLEMLKEIQLQAKALDEEDTKVTTGQKRLNSESSSNQDPIKKAKLDEKHDENFPKSRVIQKQLQKLSRNDLEELMCKKMIEVIACRSEIGEIRKKCDQQEEQVKIWKRKAQGYKKMNLDLNTVLRRYILDVQQNKTDAKPIKITRSVGLQVLDTSRRRVAQTPRPVSSNPTPPAATEPKPKSKPQPIPQPKLQPRPTYPVAVSKKTVQKQAPVVLKQQPTPPGVTISPLGRIPTTRMNTPLSMPSTVSLTRTTPTQAVVPQTVPQPQPKKVIDIVDLSDDDEPQQPTLQPATQPPAVTYFVNGATPTSLINPGATAQRNQIVVNPVAPIRGIQPTQLIRNLVPVATSPIIQRPAIQQVTYIQPQQRLTLQRIQPSHPAPTPKVANQMPLVNGKKLPSQPVLEISCTMAGIVLSWDIKTLSTENAIIKCYQIFAYQEGNQPPSTSLWKKVGDVKALPLPMACTLTQFTKGNKYHFTVRAQDIYNRCSDCSEPQAITLTL